jgi:glycosyltransferase involved in cell wall biosynthesis
MYCGTIEYVQVIEFIVDVFYELKEASGFNGLLILVISGYNPDKLNQVKHTILKANLQDFVIIKSNIEYSKLIGLYKNAIALLIPLRKTVQDMARFPHKIGEYTASRRPIISTCLGEVAYYLHHMESAFLAEEYDVKKYLEMLLPVITNDDLLNEIGQKGYDVGIENFHYKNYGRPLSDFLSVTIQ